MLDYSGEAARRAFHCYDCNKPKCSHDQDICDDCADLAERQAVREYRESRKAKAGQKTINGGFWTRESAKAYNQRLETVWQYEDAGQDPPAELLNGLHNIYTAQI